MNAVLKSFNQMIKFWRKDIMLLAVSIAPILAGVFFKFGIPFLERLLTNYFEKESIIADYYSLLDIFYSMLCSVLFCFAAVMVILEERDEKISNYLLVTPLKKKGYLWSRLGVSALIAFIITFVLLNVFSLNYMDIFTTFILSIAGTFQGLIIAMIMLVLSSNKLEAMAVSKMATMLLMGAIIPFVIKSNLQYIFFFLPSFWISKAIMEINNCYLFLAILEALIWFVILFQKYNKKIVK